MFTQSDYHKTCERVPSASLLTELANWLYPRVFRHDFQMPGAALISFDVEISSAQLRRTMVDLKENLSDIYHKTTGDHLVYLSVGRFNQQATTKFHLDGAPDQAFLMLGYEPTIVASELSIADYTRAAHDWNISPKELLSDFNPMYLANEQRLLPYATKLQGFEPSHAHIMLVNNSALPFSDGGENTLGVMHQATVPHAIPNASRTVNSTMISGADAENESPVSDATRQWFLETQEITSYKMA